MRTHAARLARLNAKRLTRATLLAIGLSLACIALPTCGYYLAATLAHASAPHATHAAEPSGKSQ